MGTIIRPEISKNNEYYISKHRYYELKHYCLQYPEWKKKYKDICNKIPSGIILARDRNGYSNIDKKADTRLQLLMHIDLIEDCAKLTDEYFANYILRGVTEGLPYSYFKVNNSIPCCKDAYYNMYRKFFYILDKKKNFA